MNKEVGDFIITKDKNSWTFYFSEWPEDGFIGRYKSLADACKNATILSMYYGTRLHRAKEDDFYRTNYMIH